MIDEIFIVTAERLRDELGELRTELRKRYRSSGAQVRAQDMKDKAATLAEAWMVNIAPRPEVAAALSSDTLADLNIHFQRLLTFSEQASIRSRYETELRAILKDFTARVLIPLKQLKQGSDEVAPQSVAPARFLETAFVGHSFLPADQPVVDAVVGTLDAVGIRVATGTKPRADRISDKVKKLIEAQHFFVGVFTHRDRIHGTNRWTTSPWVIDEKAYALGRSKRLVLLREEGIDSIGGIQGDYEFIEFSRDSLAMLVVGLLQVFDVGVKGFR